MYWENLANIQSQKGRQIGRAVLVESNVVVLRQFKPCTILTQYPCTNKLPRSPQVIWLDVCKHGPVLRMIIQPSVYLLAYPEPLMMAWFASTHPIFSLSTRIFHLQPILFHTPPIDYLATTRFPGPCFYACNPALVLEPQANKAHACRMCASCMSGFSESKTSRKYLRKLSFRSGWAFMNSSKDTIYGSMALSESYVPLMPRVPCYRAH